MGTMKDVKDYFNKNTNRTVTAAEFNEFWKSLDDAGKTYFKTAVVGLV